MKRSPIRRKLSRSRRGVEKDPDYLAFIASQPCCVCVRWRFLLQRQTTPTEAAHVGVRGLGQKCSDRETIPLCERHHRTGPLAQHKLGKLFWEQHGIDREKIIAEMQALYDESR